jgi:hypothetical protein
MIKRRMPEYRAWRSMRDRCYNLNYSSYPIYGGRGISVCEAWNGSFERFLADMGMKPSPKHSIERLDVNGNYEPNNCVWADHFQQANNRRNNRIITANGKTQTLAQWCRESGMDKTLFRLRCNLGWCESAHTDRR